MNLLVFWLIFALILISTTVGVVAFFKKKYLVGSILVLPILIIVFSILFVIRDLESCRPDAASRCRSGLRGVQYALELYNTHYKYYPEKLETPIKDGYLYERGDIDPWGNKLNYTPIYSADKRRSSITCSGATVLTASRTHPTTSPPP